jgi:hypothetical protein
MTILSEGAPPSLALEPIADRLGPGQLLLIAWAENAAHA